MVGTGVNINDKNQQSLYPKCRKPYREECLAGKGICYGCGKLGHTAKICTKGPVRKLKIWWATPELLL